MAAGCIVIGYTGVGGEEYFNAGLGISVPDADISAFAKSLISVVTEYDMNPTRLDEIRYHSASYICEIYNSELMSDSFISTWQKFS